MRRRACRGRTSALACSGVAVDLATRWAGAPAGPYTSRRMLGTTASAVKNEVDDIAVARTLNEPSAPVVPLNDFGDAPSAWTLTGSPATP